MSDQVATVVVVGLFLLVVVLEVLFRRAMARYSETRWWRQTEAWLYLEFWALLMASATPAADVPSQSPELTSAPPSGWPKVVDAVIESVAPGIPRTK